MKIFKYVLKREKKKPVKYFNLLKLQEYKIRVLKLCLLTKLQKSCQMLLKKKFHAWRPVFISWFVLFSQHKSCLHMLKISLLGINGVAQQYCYNIKHELQFSWMLSIRRLNLCLAGTFYIMQSKSVKNKMSLSSFAQPLNDRAFWTKI